MPSFSRRTAKHRQHRLLRRGLPILQIAFAVALVGAIVVAGVMWFRHRETTTANATPSASARQESNQPPPAPVCTDDALSMPLRDKLAQLLMVGVTGADDAQAVVANHRVGGIFIGGWTDLSMVNSATLGEINSSAGPLPVAVSVDEEGGRVSRLSSLIGPAPSARDLAASSSPDEAYAQAFARAQAMRGLGITIDFAPVLDVTDAPADTVIGDRSFSNNPDTVTQYAGAYARGLRDGGVLAVLKHFPGHGNASGDSHTGSVVTPPLDALEQNDLIPYRSLVGEPGVAVMVGHMQVPGLTGDQPASLSGAAYMLLRTGSYGAPGFGGLVFTDDLSSMRAISDQYGVAQAVLMSLQAGADIALWVTTDEVPAVLDRLEQAVNAGELNIADVDSKVQRIAAVKGNNPQCGG
jgi:beta-N-acetylhexosaminidase